MPILVDQSRQCYPIPWAQIPGTSTWRLSEGQWDPFGLLGALSCLWGIGRWGWIRDSSLRPGNWSLKLLVCSPSFPLLCEVAREAVQPFAADLRPRSPVERVQPLEGVVLFCLHNWCHRRGAALLPPPFDHSSLWVGLLMVTHQLCSALSFPETRKSTCQSEKTILDWRPLARWGLHESRWSHQRNRSNQVCFQTFSFLFVFEVKQEFS